jgi:hypothetical protein
VVLLVPLLVAIFHGIHRHYAWVTRAMHVTPRGRAAAPSTLEASTRAAEEGHVTLTPLYPEAIYHRLIVPIAHLDQPALQSLAYSRSISPFVTAMHVATETEEAPSLRQVWAELVKSRQSVWKQAAGEYRARAQLWDDQTRVEKVAAAIERDPHLIVIESPYRSLIPPLVTYIDALREGNGGATITIVLPEFVPTQWWEHLLYNATTARLKPALYARLGMVMVNIPYRIGSSRGAPPEGVQPTSATSCGPSGGPAGAGLCHRSR